MNRYAEQESWDQLQSLFEEAIRITEDDRQSFLDQACGDDRWLRGELEALMSSYQLSERELEKSPVPSILDGDASTEIADDAIPGYTILREVCCGGQGVVYQALQYSTQREVALKVMLQRPFAGTVGKRRFEREVELVASLRHPNIVTVFDHGVVQGMSYFAMDLIQGRHLDDYVRNEGLAVRPTLELFAKVCEAIDYAHQRGVIHRDIKPSNILVDQAGRPYVLDFGLAKIDREEGGDASLVSITGQIVGTLAYMSPEQASGRRGQVDMRSDVYALGVVLYELLTGQLPYDLDRSMPDNLLTIQETEPRRLVSPHRGINNEVGTIVLKALAKDKTRRYATAGALGDDIQRLLRGEAIEAKRDSALYVLRKMVRRNLAATVVVACFMALVAVSSVIGWSLYVAANHASELYRGEREKAQQRGVALNRSLYFAEMNLAGQAANESGSPLRLDEIVTSWAPATGRYQDQGWEWYYLNSLIDREELKATFESRQWCVAWSPDQETLVVGADDGSVRLGKGITNSTQFSLLGSHDRPVRSVDFSYDGQWIASGSSDHQVNIWHATDRTLMHQLKHDDLVLCVRWHPSNHQLASIDVSGMVRVWNATSGQLIHEQATPSSLNSVDWSPDGSRLVIGGFGAHVVVWSIESEWTSVTIGDHEEAVFCVRWDPDGSRIASCDSGGEIRVWDSSGDSLLWTKKFEGAIWQIDWSPDGRQLATSHQDGTIRVLRSQGGAVQRVVRGHSSGVWGVDWNPDGRRLATASHDKSVKVWSTEAQPAIRTFQFPTNSAESVAWNRDGTRLAVAAETGHLVDPITGITQLILEGHAQPVNRIIWSPDQSRLLTVGWNGIAIVWDGQSGHQLGRFEGHLAAAVSDIVPLHAAAWSPDGSYLATGGHRNVVFVWDAEACQVHARLDDVDPIVHDVAWHPLDKRLAIAGSSGTIRLWNPTTGDYREAFRGHTDTIRSLSWHPKGTKLATASKDGTARVWEASTERILYSLKDHLAGVRVIRWSPDGNRLVTGSWDRTIRVWDASTGAQTLVLKGHNAPINGIAWSSDGRQLASASSDGQVRVWDATLGYHRVRD